MGLEKRDIRKYMYTKYMEIAMIQLRKIIFQNENKFYLNFIM